MSDDLIVICSHYGRRYSISADDFTVGWWLYAYRPSSGLDGWIPIGEHK